MSAIPTELELLSNQEALRIDEATRFLSTLFSTRQTDERIGIWTWPDKQFKRFRNPQNAAEYALKQAETNDVYVQVGVSNKKTSGRWSAKQITGICALWADVDYGTDGHQKNNYPPTVDAALALVREMGLEPSFIVHSGHGLHTYWLLDERLNSMDAEPLAQAWLGALKGYAAQHGWDVDTTQDLARVLRVPGTSNRKKSDDVLPVHLIGETGAKYSLEAIRAAIARAPEVKFQERTAQGAGGSLRSIALQGHASHGGEYWLARYLAEVEAGASRNETGFKLACQLRDDGLALEEAKPFMLEYAKRVPESDHPYTEKEALASLAQAYKRPSREPAPSPVSTTTPARQDWPEPPSAAAFYGLAGDIVGAIEPHSEADRVALLVDFLTRFGCAAYVSQEPEEVEIPGPHLLIGATPHLPRLYVGICGPTGEGRKGESAAPDKVLFAEAEKIAHRTHECDAPDEKPTPLVNVTTLDGLASGEGLIFALRDPGQTKPTKGESSSGDHGVKDKRVLIMEPEFANLLSTMSRQGNTISPLLRTAWDGIPTLQIATKNNPMKATGTHVCFLGHITKPELLKRLSETEGVNGFANRFLWIAVRRSKCLPFPEPFAPESDKVQQLASRLVEAVDAAKRIGRVVLAEDAKRLWAEVYPRLSGSRGESMFSALVARGAPIVMRLALIYALTDGSSLIREPHLRAALALWEYSERTVRYIWGDTSGDEVADTILHALRQTVSLNRSEISALLGRNVQAARISFALNSLAERGLAASETRETKGRSVEMWRAL